MKSLLSIADSPVLIYHFKLKYDQIERCHSWSCLTNWQTSYLEPEHFFQNQTTDQAWISHCKKYLHFYLLFPAFLINFTPNFQESPSINTVEASKPTYGAWLWQCSRRASGLCTRGGMFSLMVPQGQERQGGSLGIKCERRLSTLALDFFRKTAIIKITHFSKGWSYGQP